MDEVNVNFIEKISGPIIKNTTLGDFKVDNCKMCTKKTHVQCTKCKEFFCWYCRVTLCICCPNNKNNKCNECNYVCQDCWKNINW